ncbi:MAG: 3-hydroxyacyl-CoA dehydrogenase [Proteobacteria bacterium]|nr:3-hydroxyacyl-CoA dehydrogenase [Pseudomonadota bacterium]
MDIRDSVAVITGGASGLGRQTALELAAAGARVALLDMDEERGRAVAGELGDRAIFRRTDVTDEAQVAAAMDEAVRAFDRIDVAVNCAGIGIPAKILGKEGPMDMGPFIKTIQVNVIGTMNVIRLTAARMADNEPNAEGERGVVINTASVAAYEGQIGQTAYASSKAGIIGLTLPAAREFAPLGIRVVTIAPGLFETPMLLGLPEKVLASLGASVPFPPRLGRPAEYAMLVGHIIANPMLNGTTIRLDGAIRMAAK